MNSYLFLFLAITAEVIATASLRISDGFKYYPAVIVVCIGYASAFYFLGLTLQHIPIGIAYAIWSGVGTVFIVIIGYIFFKDALSVTSIIGILLIIIGVILIKLFKS